MNFTMTKIAAAAVLAIAATGAQAAPIADLFITSGTFEMPTVTAGPVAFGAFGFDLADAYGSNANLFPFFGGAVGVFTQDGTATYIPASAIGLPWGTNVVSGGPVPNGDITGSVITMDLSAITAAWNGSNFNQGNSSVVGSYNAGTGAFTATWSSTIVGGAFAGKTGVWNVQGTAAVAAVPEASTYGMMLAGLGLVGFAVRRRKLVA